MNCVLRDELEKILEDHDDDDILKIKIEILLAKTELSFISEEDTGSVKIFPGDGSHYIILSTNYGIDERMYVAFSKIYKLGLHNYFTALHFYGGDLRVYIKKIYTIAEVKKEFDEKFNGEIKLCGDVWSYDIREE